MSGQCNFSLNTTQCTLETCCVELQGVISYQPTLAGNAAYAGIFGAILLAQIVLFILNPKTWGFFIGIAAGLILEIVGYVGRVMLHDNPFSLDNFIIYLVCLTIGPAFIMASIYIVMGRVVVAYGAHHGIVRPFYYSLICIAGDLISLILQAVGGAFAATGVQGTDDTQTLTGTHIMVAGLSFQLFSTVIFLVLCAFFFTSMLRNKHDRNPEFRSVTQSWAFKGLVAAIFLATLTIFIRSAFRVDELKDGFNSSVANDQTLFMVFEGPMLIVATLALTIFHPSWPFEGRYGAANYSTGKAREMVSEESLPMEMMPDSSRSMMK